MDERRNRKSYALKAQKKEKSGSKTSSSVCRILPNTAFTESKSNAIENGSSTSALQSVMDLQIMNSVLSQYMDRKRREKKEHSKHALPTLRFIPATSPCQQQVLLKSAHLFKRVIVAAKVCLGTAAGA